MNEALVRFLVERLDEQHDENQFGRPWMVRDAGAKRRIVDECTITPGDGAYTDGWGTLADQVLMLLALPYSDHPGYRREWKP